MLELKSTKSNSVPLSMIDKPKEKEILDKKTKEVLEKIIVYPKIDAMVAAGKKTMTWSGYVINFRTEEETYQISSTVLLDHFKTSGKKSINIHDCRNLGKLIPQKKKISRYVYKF